MNMQFKCLAASAALVLAANCWTDPVANAQEPEDKRIALELNQVASVGGKCRATLVVRNGLEKGLGKLSFDLVVFDKSGGVVAYSGIDLGELPAGKMRVRQYDVAPVGCEAISRLLINEIKQCGGTAEAGCLQSLQASSRTGIELTL